MAVYSRKVVVLLSALVVLAQLCSTESPAAPSNPNENKIRWISGGVFGQNERYEIVGETSKHRELRELAEKVHLPRTCVNLTTKQRRNELLTHLRKQISCQERSWTTHQKSGAATTRTVDELGRLKRAIDLSSENTEGFKKRIVYPVAVNLRRGTVKYLLNAADIIGRPVMIKLWAFKERKGCLPQSEVELDLSDSKKRNKNCVRAMKERYHEAVVPTYHAVSKSEIWTSIDVSQPIERIMGNVTDVCKNMDTAKLRLKAKVPKCSFQNRTTDKTQNPSQLYYMEILSKEPTPPLECTPGEKRCCRETTYVEFKELSEKTSGYILAPRGFLTAHCKGSCENLSTGRHNGACCVPSKTTSIHVLHYNQGQVAVQTFQDIVVKECGCR